VKRIRQIIVALLGLFYVGLLYPLYTDLWHSKWLIEMHNEECEPMFLTLLCHARSVSIVGCAKAHAVQARDCFRSVAQPRTFGNQDRSTTLWRRDYFDVASLVGNLNSHSIIPVFEK
jgi:hypothetical protein